MLSVSIFPAVLESSNSRHHNKHAALRMRNTITRVGDVIPSEARFLLGGPIERMWLRQNSKMPHLVAKSVLALSFTSHASS